MFLIVVDLEGENEFVDFFRVHFVLLYETQSPTLKLKFTFGGYGHI